MKRNILLVITTIFMFAASAQSYTPETFKQWGDECYQVTEDSLRVSGVYSYEETIRGHQSRATCWPLGVQLKALIWGGRISQAENTYDFFHRNYFNTANGIDGYDAVYKNSNVDRYYDDNAWIAKLLVDLYIATNKKEIYLERAKMVINFCMSGESPVGGLHWHESESSPSHENYYTWSIISTIPTALACLKVYRETGEEQYLTDGKRLYDFVREQGFHGIGGGYRGYENAVVMQSALLLYQITNDESYLDDAYQMAYSMESVYISWSDHVLHEVGKWGGHDMADAYIDLYNFDNNPRWLGIVAGYLVHIYNNIKDEDGFYPEEWDSQDWKFEPKVNGSRIYGLIEQASATSSFYRLASTPITGIKEKEPVAIFKHNYYNKKNAVGQWDENGTEVGIDGWSIGLLPGRYTSEDLRKRGMCTNRFVLEKELSSMIIEDGYRVMLYSQDNFTGTIRAFTVSTPTMGTLWDNRAASIIVEKIGESSIDEVNNELLPQVYPTVFSEEISIENLMIPTQIKIVDSFGRQLFELIATDSELSISLGFLSNGIYFLSMTNDNQHVTKIIKH